VNPEVPKELDTITLKAISKDADIRYESARAFKQALLTVAPSLPPEQITEALGKSVTKKTIPERKISIWERIVQQSYYLEAAFLGVTSSVITYYYLQKNTFYPSNLKLLIILLPLILTFLSNRLTLWTLVLIFSLPLIKISVVQALIFFILLAFYAALFNELKPVYGILPFLVFILVPFRATLAFPLLIGLFIKTSYSPLIAGMGCLFFEIFQLKTIKESALLWPFNLPNKFLPYPGLSPKDTLFQAALKLISPFSKEPVLLVQIAVWGLSALALGFVGRFFLKQWQGSLAGLVSATILLWASYAWLLPLFNLPGAQVEVPLLLSFFLSALIYALYQLIRETLEKL
jgi:hypothetical protein